MDRSIEAIRRRLFYLQLKSFVIVVLLSMIVTVGVMVLVINSSVNVSPLERLPAVSRLQGFYIGNDNSWTGVEQLTHVDSELGQDFWNLNYLVDPQNMIILGTQPDGTNLAGQAYSLPANDHEIVPIDIRVDEQIVGRLVINASSLTPRIAIIGPVLAPLAGIVVFLGMFLVVSNYYLIRRIIIPLSGTIAAANEVAKGNLHTRVQVNGPDDLRGLNDTFNVMIQSLEDYNANRREFLADIAHELRTPLTIMRGRLEGILDGIYTADESHVAPILQETYLLERLVDDLRILTLAETRQLHFDRKLIDLTQIARDSVEVFSAQANLDKVSLEVRTSDEAITAFADVQRIEQVIGNVLSNALRHASAGGHIWLDVSKSADGAVITIQDDGPGVPDEDVKHLFDRFWRKDKSRSRQTGGTGLGLAISRQLIEAQGGNISATNRADGGLCVSILLPVDEAEPGC